MAYDASQSRVFTYVCMLIISYVFGHPSYLSTTSSPAFFSPFSFPNNNSSNFVLGPISLVSIHSECFLSGEVRTGSHWFGQSINNGVIIRPASQSKMGTIQVQPVHI